MSTLLEQIASEYIEDTQLAPPVWVAELVGDAPRQRQEVGSRHVQMCSLANEQYTLVSAYLQNARKLTRDDLADTVYRCYMKVAQVFGESSATHPVRFWNHLCRIHEPMGGGLDRYMAFNIGRYKAFCEWYGSDQNFDRCIATASGVGCHGEDVVIHALAANRPGIAVANPRQVQPFRYSRRYGPRPPCFARATLLPMGDSAPILLIGGTASIRGEESMFIGDLEKQLDETFENLASLITHGGHVAGRKGGLRSVEDLRIYVVDPTTSARIEKACRTAMPNCRDLQLQPADLCRRDLLVEIEGRAVLE